MPSPIEIVRKTLHNLTYKSNAKGKMQIVFRGSLPRIFLTGSMERHRIALNGLDYLDTLEIATGLIVPDTFENERITRFMQKSEIPAGKKAKR